MKKVIRITNEPNFHKGVKSYVIACKCGTLSEHYCAPFIEKAKDYSKETEETTLLELAYIKESFPKATVELITH